MSCDSNRKLSDLLPLYAAGTLAAGERRVVEEHLAGCRACRDELVVWRDVRAVLAARNAALPVPPPALPDRVLIRARRRRVGPLARAWALAVAQVRLVRQEIWLASAFVMAVGYLAAVIAGRGSGASIVSALAPLVAAAGVAMICGPENDPGLELALATPTSPRQVLLARLVLVYGYDLLLALGATAGLLAVVPPELLGAIILGWLAPMTCLSALALVLSMCIGTGNALTVATVLWLGRCLAADSRFFRPDAGTLALRAAQAYVQAWRSPALLFGLAAAFVVAALWLAGRQEPCVAQV